jgi:aspartate kinase
MDIDDFKLNNLVKLLGEDYLVRFNRGLELVTIRHYDQATIDRVSNQKEILMEQKTRHTARIVMKGL